MAAISTMASPKLNRRDGLSRMARPWKVWLLVHPYHIPASSCACPSAPTMNDALHTKEFVPCDRRRSFNTIKPLERLQKV